MQGQHDCHNTEDAGSSILLASRLLLPAPALSSHEGWLCLSPPPGSKSSTPSESQVAAIAKLYGNRYVLLDPYAQRLAIFAASAPSVQQPLALIGLRGAVAVADSWEGAGPGAFVLQLRVAEDLASCWVPTPSAAGIAGKLDEEAAVVASRGLRLLLIHAEAPDATARRDWLARLTAAAATGEEDGGGGAHHTHHPLTAEGGASVGNAAHYQMESGNFNEPWSNATASKPAAERGQSHGAEISSMARGTLPGRSSPGNGGAGLTDDGGGAAQQQPPSTIGHHCSSCITSCLLVLFRRRASNSTLQGQLQPKTNAKI